MAKWLFKSQLLTIAQITWGGAGSYLRENSSGATKVSYAYNKTADYKIQIIIKFHDIAACTGIK